MKYFEWLGVSPAESIGLIKKISKKKIHQEDFDNLTDRLRKQWIINTGSEDKFDETFADIQSCMSYGFAAPHALAVAIDSLYSAYLKVHYPMEYYTVCLNLYGSNQDKTRRLTKELDYFNIKVVSPKFRYSGANYVPNKESRCIYKGIASIKYINKKVADNLYSIRNNRFDSFVDFLKVNPCDDRQTRVLIKLGFFSEFGKRKKLLSVYDIYKEYGKCKQINKDSIKSQLIYDTISKFSKETKKQFREIQSDKLVYSLCKSIPDKELILSEILEAQLEYLGYVDYLNRSMKKVVYVLETNTKYTPRVTLYSLSKGTITEAKIPKLLYNTKHIDKGKIFLVKKYKICPKTRFVDGNYIPIDGTSECWIKDLEVMEC